MEAKSTTIRSTPPTRRRPTTPATWLSIRSTSTCWIRIRSRRRFAYEHDNHHYPDSWPASPLSTRWQSAGQHQRQRHRECPAGQADLRVPAPSTAAASALVQPDRHHQHALYDPTRVGGNLSGNPAQRGITLRSVLDADPVRAHRRAVHGLQPLQRRLRNYDGSGRNAGDNNSLFFYVWGRIDRQSRRLGTCDAPAGTRLRSGDSMKTYAWSRSWRPRRRLRQRASVARHWPTRPSRRHARPAGLLQLPRRGPALRVSPNFPNLAGQPALHRRPAERVQAATAARTRPASNTCGASAAA